MENGRAGKADLKDVFCNDVRHCMRSVSTSQRPHHAYGELVTSFQVAVCYGVALESLAATLISQLPDCERQKTIKKLTAEFNLDESQILQLLNPAD